MKHYFVTSAALLALGMVSAVPATAAPELPLQLAQRAGSGMGQGTANEFTNMMTERERSEFQKRIKNAGSEEERERIRAEFHERVQQRSKERHEMMRDERRRPREGSSRGGGRGR